MMPTTIVRRTGAAALVGAAALLGAAAMLFVAAPAPAQHASLVARGETVGDATLACHADDAAARHAGFESSLLPGIGASASAASCRPAPAHCSCAPLGTARATRIRWSAPAEPQAP
jgi:hypothetical protein